MKSLGEGYLSRTRGAESLSAPASSRARDAYSERECEVSTVGAGPVSSPLWEPRDRVVRRFKETSRRLLLCDLVRQDRVLGVARAFPTRLRPPLVVATPVAVFSSNRTTETGYQSVARSSVARAWRL